MISNAQFDRADGFVLHVLEFVTIPNERNGHEGGSDRTQKKTWHGDRWWGMLMGTNQLLRSGS